MFCQSSLSKYVTSFLSTKKKKKKAQRKSCELSFIWGKMRAIAQETAFQIVLRNCSEEVEGKASIIYGFSEGGSVQSSTHFGRGLLLVTRADVPANDFSAFLDM